MKTKIATGLVMITFVGFAQVKNIGYSNQQWMQYYCQFQLSQNWSVNIDGGLRKQNEFKEWSQTLIRGGISYSFNPVISVSAGLAYFTSYQSDKPVKDDKRIWQEFALKEMCGRFNLQHRFRLEERYFHTFSGNDQSFNYRIRYRFYLTLPLNHSSLSANTVFLLAGDEIFVNFGKNVLYNMYDQNRVLGGVGYKLNESLQFSLTYVYQFAQKNKALSFEETEIFWFSIIHKIKWKKKNDQNEQIKS